MTASPSPDTSLDAELLALLSAVADPDHPPPADPDAPLELRSLQVVSLVDLIEATFDLLLTSDDITRANFATRRALAALLGSRLPAPTPRPDPTAHPDAPPT